MTLATITTRVILNGSQVGAHEVSWKAAISNDLPARFSSGDTVPMRTGTIRWANSQGIAQWVSPLSAYYPKPGDTVVVETTVRTPTVTRIATEFTGVIDSTTGGMHEPLESTIIDYSDALRRSISRDPLIQRLPSRQGTENSPRWVGLQYSYPLYEAAKKCGFGVQYPEKAGSYCLDVSLAGSLWADRFYGAAELIAGGQDESFSSPPLFATLNGNRGLVIGAASWVNSAVSSLGANGFYTEFDLFSPGATPTMRLEFRFENGGYMGLRIEQRNIQISTDGATWETICPLPGSSSVIGFFYPAQVGQNIQVRVNEEFFVAQTARASASARLLPDPVSEKVTPTNSPIFLTKSGTGMVANLLVGLMTSTRNTEAWWKRIVRSRRAALDAG